MLLFLLKTAIASLTYDAGRVCSLTQLCPILCDPMDYSHRLLCPWNFPGENTGVGSHFLLQGIFVTQGPNSCLLCFLHLPLWQADSLPLSHLGSLKSFITLLLLHIAIAITYYYCNYMLIIITYFLKLHSPVILHITTTGNNIRTTII